MSSTQSSATMSSNNSQANCLVDPLDSMLDFSEYETVQYQSPSLSPSGSKSSQFSTRSVSNTPALLPPSQPSPQTFSRPSHNYDMYRQTTGIPQGALANTLAVNSNNIHINQYGFGDSNYLTSGVSPSEDFIDFGSAPLKYHPADMDTEFDSPNGDSSFFFDQANDFIDPSAIASNNSLQTTPVVPTQTGNVGRLWPGMHQQQAALAKAQAQQKQQQQIIQQQRQNANGGQQAKPTSQRPRASNGPADPIVEEKISQLLNSMRQSSVTTEGDDSTNNGMSNAQRMRKDEEDMDEDERLLASEEGKKLSSKERRQLRNKVSARAFRSRRKEYIGQLEGEIAQKVNENTDLRNQNRALLEENTRLSDLTRMLLSSPSFSGFLDTLSQNPAAAQVASTPAPIKQQPQQQQQVRKDASPYTTQPQQQQQHIGMTLMPEQNIDFSMLDLGNNGYGYQPQVFSVHSIPETIIDAEALSGKPNPSALSTNSEKIEIPVLERTPTPVEAAVEIAPVEATETVDEEFDAAFELFASSPSAPVSVSAPQELDISALLSSIPVKPTQYTLVVESSINEDVAEAALRKVLRLGENIDRMSDMLKSLTFDL